MVTIEKPPVRERASNDDVSEGIEVLDLQDKKIVTKKNLHRIDISELPSKLPDFDDSNETKDNILANWLIEWIEESFKKGKVHVNELLPKKNVLAAHLGISIGTVQTAIRYIEDKGYVESKQRIGTFIRDYTQPVAQLRKQTSKREQAVLALKKIIITNGYNIDEPLPSSRELAKIIGSAPNTTCLALEYLASNGILESKGSRGNKANWVLKQIPAFNKEKLATDVVLDSDTLVDQVERDLKELINKRYEVNDKLPSHFELAEILKVSIKTVHDAMKRLVAQNILRSKRGRYGTYILRMPSDLQTASGKENAIFAPAEDASLYNYEKIECHLKVLIKENYKVGDKLPAMGKLAGELNVSSNTIRKALQRLSDDNIVKFSRGRYGGTFVTQIPLESFEDLTQFTWLAVNQEHMSAYSNGISSNDDSR